MSAMIFSFVSNFFFDSLTKTLMIKYSPFGKNTIPILFTAAVISCHCFGEAMGLSYGMCQMRSQLEAQSSWRLSYF